MLLSEHVRESTRPDWVEEPSGGALEQRSPAARGLDAVRDAIAALSAAAAVQGCTRSATGEPTVLALLSRLDGCLSAYQSALDHELAHHAVEGRSARARAVLRQHVAFALRGLIADLDAMRAELRRHGEVAPVLRKTWCLALATSVAIDHLAEDLARFRGRPHAAR